MKKRFFLLFVMVGLLVTLASCAASNKYDKLTLDSDYYEIYKGQTLEIKPIVNKGSAVKDVTVEYSSYDETIATYVDGKLQGVEYGETIIKVVYAGNATICDVAKVKVVEHDLASEVEVDETPVSLYETDTYQITCAEAPAAVYTFESSNEDVATVDANGVVTAALDGAQHNDGKAVITVTASDLYGAVEDVVFTVEVTVKEAHFAISYELEGGELSGTYVTEYDYHEACTLPVPTRKGYTFEGWLLNGETVEAIPANTEGAVTVKAQWKAITWTITYELDGGVNAEANPESYETDGEAVVLAEPTKEGHTFAGWYLDGELVTELPTNTHDHLTVVAKWTVNSYYVKLWGMVQVYQAYGEYFALNGTEPRAKEGHTFIGWDIYEDGKEGDGEVDDIPETMPAYNTVAVEVYAVNTYTITYNDFNALSNENAKEYTYGKGYTLLDPNKPGYTFEGWYTNEEFEGEAVEAISATDTGNKVFYAKYTKIVYTVTFDANGGDAVETIEFNVATETFALEPATRLGYTFLGWFDAEGVEVKEVVKGTIKNIEVKAEWELNEYVIKFSKGDGASYIPNLAYTVNTPALDFTSGVVTIDGEEYTFAKEGYSLVGWTIAKSGFANNDGAAFGPSLVLDPVELIAKGIGESVFAVAKWEINDYTITYVVDGKETEETYEFGAAVTAPANPEKEGHTFAGWDVEIPATMPGKDLTITAKFEANKYTITVYLDDNGTVLVFQNQPYGTDNLLTTLEGRTKVGYSFVGWDIKTPEKDFDGEVDETPLTVQAFDIVAKPVYDLNLYTITVHLDDNGTVLVFQNQPYGTANLLTTLNARDKVGHEWIGWDIQTPEKDFDGEVDETPLTVQAFDIVAKPVYDPDTYNITYKGQGATNSAEFPATYDFGVGLTLPVASKPGYKFLGWTVEEESEEYVTAISAEETGDKVFYAQWELQTSTLTFDANGGEAVEAIEFTILVKGQELPVTTKEGYTFVGWFETVGEKELEVTEITGRPSSFTVVAKWEALEYGITYDLAGGALPEGKSNPDKYLSDAKVELVAPEKEGYEFAGWLVNDKLIETFPSNSYADVELVASWTVKTYVVTLVVDGEETEVEFEYGAKVEGIATPEKENYTFKAWSPALPATMPAENLTVEATWRATIYTITYVAPETVKNNNPKEYTVESETIVLEAFEAEHIEFKGWYSDEALTVELKEIAKGTSGNLTVYASYEAAKYAINYTLPEIEGLMFVTTGTNKPLEAEYEYASVHELEDLELPGYTFDGWYANGNKVEEIDAAYYEANKDLTFVAKYTINEYTLTFDAVLEGVEAPEAVKYNIESPIELPTLAKEGYVFKGWGYYAEGKFIALATNKIEKGNFGNITFYAIWEAAEAAE